MPSHSSIIKFYLQGNLSNFWCLIFSVLPNLPNKSILLSYLFGFIILFISVSWIHFFLLGT